MRRPFRSRRRTTTLADVGCLPPRSSSRAKCSLSRLMNGRAARLHTFEDPPWRRRCASTERERSQMHGRDGSDDGGMRPGELRGRPDFAGVVHAHFEHHVFRARRAARERKRHAPVIVVGGGRGVRLRLRSSSTRAAQRLLGAGLSDPAGHADRLWHWVRARAARASRVRAFQAHRSTTRNSASFPNAAALAGGNHRKTRARLPAPRRRNRGRRGRHP